MAYRLARDVGVAIVCGFGTGFAFAQSQPQPVPSPEVVPAPREVRPVEPSEALKPVVKPGSLPEVEVWFTDGKRISGQLVDLTDDHYVLRIAGVDTKFSRNEVSEVKPLPSLQARYRMLRDSIDNTDVERLIRLAEWLRSKQMYDEAVVEIDHVLSLEFDNPDAKDLRTLIIEQKKIADLPRREAVANRPDTAAKPDRFVFPMLNADQINLIRVFEMDVSNTRFLIDRQDVDEFAETYADRLTRAYSLEQRAVYARGDPKQIVRDMFSIRAREFYPRIRVLDDPVSMKRFRDDVHREWLSNSCATSQCHGGEDAGRLWLFGRNAGSKESVYTNFLILDRFRTTDGRPLIDFDQPSRSVLLQFGLPREDALTPHPEVQNFGRPQKWRPVFTGEKDDRFIAAMEWIGSMTVPHVDYPVDYEPPRPRGGVVARPDIIINPQPR